MAEVLKVAVGAEDDGGLLSDRIRNALTDEIASGALVAGSALEEQQLADRFGASRTPVREALRQLVVSGLVEVRGRRGLVVARMTPERIMDMFETSAEVEAMCVRLATYRMTPLERSHLIELHEGSLAMVEANDDDTRRVALARHAQHVEQRVRELGQKSYWEQFEHSPEFAVLFLPGDQFLSAALAERPDLIESALKQRIIVTTPSTLMALLKVIAYGWRQSRVTENAREIRKLGEDLHKRLTTFVSHLQKVSRSLGNAVDSFNASVGSMERNVLPQARKFTELGVAGDEVASIDPIEQLVRLPASESKPPSGENTDETQN